MSDVRAPRQIGRSMSDTTSTATGFLDRQGKMNNATEMLHKAEQRATAGLLALEVMHEIRNPLEALGNLVYLTLACTNEPEKVRMYMELADEQIANMSRVALQTLGYVNGSGDFVHSSLAELAESALRIHTSAIEAKKVRLLRNFPAEITAPVHKGEMLQVISNLIVNAVDALPADGTLSLRITKCHGMAHFTIADNGHGIPAEHRNAIFEPFFTTKDTHGTGLGLAVSRKIVERHKGKIYLRSSVHPHRHGTTFKVSLPI